jgi:hypothetical protein
LSIPLTIYNVILIFFFIVVPGYLFRRFFFIGEFYKQLNPKSYLLNVIYSFFVGILFTLIFVLVVNFFKSGFIDIEKTINKFDTNFISNSSAPPLEVKESFDDNFSSNTPSKFANLYNNIYKKYLPYLLVFYILSAFFGYFLNKFILLFNFDTKLRILRFKNPWHYLFTGRILKLDKFRAKELKNLKVKYTYLDVLVMEGQDKNTLYSGLYVDYHLNNQDINKLEKLYLLKALRYTNNPVKREAKSIPGKIFTILGSNILNINCTYIFEESSVLEHKLFKRKKVFLTIGNLFTSIFFSLITICIFFKIEIFEFSVYKNLLISAWYVQLLFVLLLNVFLGFVTPFDIDNKEEQINFIGYKAVLNKVILSVILFLLLWWIW